MTRLHMTRSDAVELLTNAAPNDAFQIAIKNLTQDALGYDLDGQGRSFVLLHVSRNQAIRVANNYITEGQEAAGARVPVFMKRGQNGKCTYCVGF